MYLPDRAKELISSRSSVQAMYFCPNPIVYFPLATPSKSSNSSSEMHWKSYWGSVSRATWDRRDQTYSSGEVNLESFDSDVLGTCRHCGNTRGKECAFNAIDG